MNEYYVVTYRGKFAYIKPWTAVRDGETFSQQFVTPSIIEGIEKKLFPELLNTHGIHKIVRHKLMYNNMDTQQEVVQTRAWDQKKRMLVRPRSILNRNVLLHPVFSLAFASEADAAAAARQHVCLCRNEDVLLPDAEVRMMGEADFGQLPGFELRFGKSSQSFLVGYNRFHGGEPMYGWLEYGGDTVL